MTEQTLSLLIYLAVLIVGGGVLLRIEKHRKR